MRRSASKSCPRKRSLRRQSYASVADRTERRILAHIGTEVAFQAPERDDDRRGHAEFLLDAREGRRIRFDQRLAALNTVGRGHAAGEIQKGLGEDPLAAVDIDDLLVVGEVGGGRRYGALGNLLRQRLALEGGEPGVIGAGGVARCSGGCRSGRRRGCGLGRRCGFRSRFGGRLRGWIGRRRRGIGWGRRMHRSRRVQKRKKQCSCRDAPHLTVLPSLSRPGLARPFTPLLWITRRVGSRQARV